MHDDPIRPAAQPASADTLEPNTAKRFSAPMATPPSDAGIANSGLPEGSLLRYAIIGLAIVGLMFLCAIAKSNRLRHLLYLYPSSNAPATAMSADVADQYLKAQDLLRHSDKDASLAAAVSGFQSVLARDPSDPLVHARLGTAYLEQYRENGDPRLHDQAKAAISKALELDPSLAPTYASLARMEAMDGHTDLALRQAQKAITLDFRSPEAYAALAEVHDDQGKESDAIDAIQKAISLPKTPCGWCGSAATPSSRVTPGRP